MTRNLLIGLAAAVIVGFAGVADGGQSILRNASMEQGSGPNAEDPRIPAEWTLQGSVVERSGEANLVPGGGGFALKAFQSQEQEFAYQEVSVAPGSNVTVSAQLYTRSTDDIDGDAQAGITLSFYNDAEIQVGSTQTSFVLNPASPEDTWIPASIGPVTVPAGATVARMTCIWVSTAGQGSAFWDDAQLTVDGGANLLLNGDFEQAGVGDSSPTGIDEWNGFNDQAKSSDFAFHGEYSLNIGTDNSFSGLYQNHPDYLVSSGDRLLLRARVYQPSGTPLTANARAGIKLEFAAASGGDLPSPTENLPFDADSTTNAWVQVDLGTSGIEVPANATQARIVLIFVPDNASSSGYAYYDAAFAAVDSAPGTNLLTNGHFEFGAVRPDGWGYFETEGESEAKLSLFEVPGYPDDEFGGTAKIGGTNYAGLTQEIDVTPGEILNASVQMYMLSANKLVGTAKAGIKVEWVGGTTPGQVDITEDASDNTITAASATDTWIPLEIDFTMPEGTQAHPRFVAIGAAGNGTGEVYFDALELTVTNVFDGADANGDGTEDLLDFAVFQRCFNGDGAGDLGWNCTVFDVDEDLDVDLTDFTYFQPRLTGP